MATKKNSPDYLHGVPELLVLRLLRDREMYGYEIVQGIRIRTNQDLVFGEGVIYPLLHSLQKRRLLAIRRAKVNGRPRIYYRLTKSGLRKLDDKISEWSRITEAIQSVLESEADEPERTV